jgi:hypothetical protein
MTNQNRPNGPIRTYLIKKLHFLHQIHSTNRKLDLYRINLATQLKKFVTENVEPVESK